MDDKQRAVNLLELPFVDRLALRHLPDEIVRKVVVADPMPPFVGIVYEGLAAGKQPRVLAGLILDPHGLGWLAGQIRAAVDRLGGNAVAAFTSGFDRGYREQEQRHGSS